jgi:hypothetical protein
LTSRRSIEALASRNLDGVSSSHGRPVKQATKRLEALIAGWH